MKRWLMLFFVITNCYALSIKVGVLAPEGTSWAKHLKEMAKEIKKATEGEVKLKIYFGGSQGDEPDVLRKIRIGQLQGGIFSGKTLGDINGDVRAIELPFTFHADQDKAWKTLQAMVPFFEEGFRQNKFVNLGFFGLGLVYFVSQKEVKGINDIKNLKIWSWEGDPLVEVLIKAMNLVTVPLPLPDVLSSLSNGIIDSTYSPPLAIVSLQWHAKVKYLINFPITYSVGAFLVTDETWNKISKDNQKKVLEVSQKYCGLVNSANVRENNEALEGMKAMGVQFISFSEKDYVYAKSFRGKMIKELEGKLFSSKALKKIEQLAGIK